MGERTPLGETLAAHLVRIGFLIRRHNIWR